MWSCQCTFFPLWRTLNTIIKLRSAFWEQLSIKIQRHFWFLFFFLSQSNRFSSLLAGHICVAALNTPGLFPSKVVAFELTGKTCSEQAEAASWKSCRFMMSSSCFIHRNNLLTLASAHATRNWFGALHLFK